MAAEKRRQGTRPRRPGSTRTRASRALFEVREEELVARHPKQTIAMCVGEVFVGKTPHGAAMKAKKAHPGRASFLHLYGIDRPSIWR